MRPMLTIVVAIVVVGAALLLIDRFVYPMRRVELHLLSLALSYGRGLDDGASVWLAQHQDRYAPEILRSLRIARPGSDQERSALGLVEFVLDAAGVRDALKRFGCSHTNAETVRFVADVFEGPPTTVPVATVGTLVIAEVVTRERPSPSLPEEKGRLGCGEG